ncbi:MAG TPA: adenylyltransferase/cytidyltransferase family protein [Acholeplasmataceae bacterium]|nr:adenylyltransferase/cytidyltransferase family protein [Acholeplasmataceae bacterium]
MKYKIGFTQGTFDTLHYGHINLLKNAKEYVDYLIVGINNDELVKSYKKVDTIIKTSDRVSIIEAIRYVDEVIVCDTLDKLAFLKKLNFDVVFIGDDWKGSKRWNETEAELKKYGVDVVYLPYTKSISTTYVKEQMSK